MNKEYKIFLTILPLFIVFAGKLAATDFKFNSNGKFKIVQVTDSHIKSDDVIPSNETVTMLNQVLDAERPDLVIFTGDIVTGKPYKSGFEMVIEPVIRRKLPWALVFGNHDNEQDLNYEQLADLIQSTPYNVGKMKKMKNVSGYGNFTIEIKGKDSKKIQAVLYCMDSHAYSKIDSVKGYDWFAFDQVEWYRKKSEKYTASNKGIPLPALAFFHIPLLEYRTVYTQKGHKIIGSQLENVCSPEINTGMFTAMLEKGDVMGTFVGHDHNNDYIFNYYGIALTYGRFSGSKTTYGDLKNGVRVIELTEGQKGFDTWIRLNSEEVIHQVKFPDDLPLSKK
ncbi:MAG: metallophosphoesterase family protein [Prevotellaceae bacterium]|jgi:3',5'-cyclic AMP phosphodiesterase CpdA|nr:metallophosphoesterase family protein [Prevotellaceae bacterium]